jgi:hypothetical protein
MVSVPSGQSGFFGVTSDVLGEITRVSVNLGTAFDVIDTVAFGVAAPTAVPEPATLAGGLLSVVVGVGLWRHRRRP